jgi:hypothetical protein
MNKQKLSESEVQFLDNKNDFDDHNYAGPVVLLWDMLKVSIGELLCNNLLG